jgi:putative tributyrin esterase
MSYFRKKPKGRTDGEHFVEGELSTIRNSGNDLFHLATQLAESGRPQPKLFQCCGTEDFLYEENVRFRNHCRQLGLELSYEEESGKHEWGYWDNKIQRVLSWLPLREE